MIPHSPEAYQLLHRGALALAQVESHGIRVDRKYLRRALRETQNEIKELQEGLQNSKVGRIWRRTFGAKTNFDATQQLGKILFDVAKIAESPGRTEKGQHKTDEDSLVLIKHPFVRDYLKVRKRQKGINFLKGIQRELVGQWLRPSFNLHIVKTYRSSSDAPNFQNLPVRDAWLSKLVRRCIIARARHCIVEVDYSGVEVKVAYCLHRDPKMKKYLEDPKSDMHRDSAIRCFKLPKDTPPEWWKTPEGKAVRHSAKNQFVFPEFYGNYYAACARDMWREIHTRKLVAPDGTPMLKWLRSKGIKRLGDQAQRLGHDDELIGPPGPPEKGTFEYHIRQVEDEFWNEDFPVYTQWKKDQYAQYQETGWVQTVTGFIVQGYMKRNEVLNYPIQGPAFHCLLWSLIQLQGCEGVKGALRKAGLKAKIIGQIHDSIVADVPEEEVDDFLVVCHDVMVRQLMEHWDWIITPLDIEAEVTPPGGSWVEKVGRDIPEVSKKRLEQLLHPGTGPKRR